MAFFLALGIYLGSFIHHSVKVVLALSFLLFSFSSGRCCKGEIKPHLLVLLVVLLGLFRYQLQWRRTSHLAPTGERLLLPYCAGT